MVVRLAQTRRRKLARELAHLDCQQEPVLGGHPAGLIGKRAGQPRARAALESSCVCG
ncbi:MAG: hypothetical protein AVDCRST_MAG89-3137 [uncultured Gemmatimonadetes bacterium]|uniref:Uncharacterized protein n=1 Tax=uncultured Gemmatimonadota bacterium TaxID=203437 RepID=A0A6J4M7V7_9BACT|nr:MAG: hypothetical protein AVDCRST_MAG89-3137 [uncultured Gemmatimonadota bacterium]